MGSVLWQQRGFGSSSVASFFLLFCTVSSKSPVPEGDFERSDLPLFSGFVPVAHAVGWSPVGTVGESGFFAISMRRCRDICISETYVFVIFSYTFVYFNTFHEAIVEVPVHSFILMSTASASVICPLSNVLSIDCGG